MYSYGRRTLALAAFALAILPATAETAVDEPMQCPTGAVSVYFAPGESLASDETVDLIGRVGEVAADCRAAGVDIVAWVDPAEGAAGMGLALERLKLVAQHLGEGGLPPEQMRVGARVQTGPEHSGLGARNVRIILREQDGVTRADTTPPVVRQPAFLPPNAV